MHIFNDKLHEACGLFGIYNHQEAAKLTYLGLFALQHRGQESAGIATSYQEKILLHKEAGLVTNVFSEKILSDLLGSIAIGHTRYSTSGGSGLVNAQPLVINYHKKGLAIAHNGHFVNTESLRDELEENGSIFQTISDSEVLLHLLTRSKKKELSEALIDVLPQINGSYSLLLMTPERLIGIRDPLGFRPLSLGTLNDSYILASETCAFNLLGKVDHLRDVEPGEMVIIDKNGLNSIKFATSKRYAQCIFEYIYFSRPDSKLFGQNVHEVRKKIGQQLAVEHPVEADLVIGVPDSGISASLGFSKESGIPFDMGLMRNHYIGRTFISPLQVFRDFEVKIKLNPILDVLKGKKVVLIDDSIVRGTTSKKIVSLLKNSGVLEIHFRISSPPIKYPCFYGIDTPERKKLLASYQEIEEIRRFLEVDSIAYVSISGLLKSVSNEEGNFFCTACFDGSYPTEIKD
ncbi:amidophosphoribosyltransferase [bacterium]|nr:amidophosphoribosyltransferase [bacterium]MBU1152559.1 amidophosphoribosyltransferase [bacterium]MBU1781899.1 amidophosphoribosyltransferase [bacterium]